MLCNCHLKDVTLISLVAGDSTRYLSLTVMTCVCVCARVLFIYSPPPSGKMLWYLDQATFTSFHIFSHAEIPLKCTIHPWTGHEVPEGELRYNPTLSLTPTLDGGRWSTSRPGRFTLGQTRYPLYRRFGGPQGRSEQVQKMSLPTEFDPRTVQPVGSRYPGPNSQTA